MEIKNSTIPVTKPSFMPNKNREKKNSWIHYTKFDDFHKVTLKYDKKKCLYTRDKKDLLLKVLIETIGIKMLKKTVQSTFYLINISQTNLKSSFLIEMSFHCLTNRLMKF